MRAQLERDFARFAGGLPPDFAEHVRDTYHIDLTARYLGQLVPHPVGKGSGQLSLKEEQLETDAEAGLAYVVLKTVIAEDERGTQSMAAWAVHESRMAVEPIRSGGASGWTVTWKGRGWDRSFDDYLRLVRAGRDFTRAGRLLVVPSVKYHLPMIGEAFRESEYAYTTGALAALWGDDPLLLEKDFSPTLAGDPLADETERILRWVHETPAQIRKAAPHGVKLALKLMNSRFDDDFQVGMVRTATEAGADAAVVFNRLFDSEKQVAYGGWALSDRNLRVLSLLRDRGAGGKIALVGTGNICSGRLVLEYARLGCESVQLHTFFQLPLSEYPATAGSRTARALHALIFDPLDGLVAGMLDLEAGGVLDRVGGELRFLDIPASVAGG
jgi:hypothetical protein